MPILPNNRPLHISPGEWSEMQERHHQHWRERCTHAIELLQQITPNTMEERDAHKQLFYWLESLRDDPPPFC